MEKDMLAEDLGMSGDCMSQYFAETQSQSGMLQFAAKHEELEESRGLLSKEDSAVASCYENCHQVLQELEGLLAQCEEQCEAARPVFITTGKQETEQVEKHRAKTVALLHESIQKTEMLRREIRNFEEELEEEEACQLQVMKEAETPETTLPEVVEEQMEKNLRARRRGFIYWLQMRCVLFVVPELAVIFALSAAVLYSSYCDTEFLYHLLLNTLCEEAYNNVVYAVGRVLTVVSEGPLPF